MKPLIAIVATSGEDRNKAYIESVETHGGHPVLLGTGDDFEKIEPQGVLLTGGGDLSECYYDHPINELERKSLGTIEPQRESFEWKLLQWASAREVPTLGICRGFQILNAFAGGTLIPDIPAWQEKTKVVPRLLHRAPGDPSEPAHLMEIEKKSRLYELLGKSSSLEVNSSHHQALGAIASGLIVTARAPDGIIEALEDPTREFWMGVQFHPERMWPKFPIFSNLFRRLTELAAQRVP